LTPGAKSPRIRAKSGRNSVVECQLPKLDVAGSNPVARSNFSYPSVPSTTTFTPFRDVLRRLPFPLPFPAALPAIAPDMHELSASGASIGASVGAACFKSFTVTTYVTTLAAWGGIGRGCESRPHLPGVSLPRRMICRTCVAGAPTPQRAPPHQPPLRVRLSV
jgi:hypothetical protein